MLSSQRSRRYTIELSRLFCPNLAVTIAAILGEQSDRGNAQLLYYGVGLSTGQKLSRVKKVIKLQI